MREKIEFVIMDGGYVRVIRSQKFVDFRRCLIKEGCERRVTVGAPVNLLMWLHIKGSSRNQK